MKTAVLEQIAELEREIFSDAWSSELLRDTFKYDYNHLIVIGEAGEPVEAAGFVYPGISEKTAQADQMNCDVKMSEDSEFSVAGYIIYSKLDIFELQRIAVSEKFRRRGLADKLMKMLIGAASCSDADEAGSNILLEVRAGNLPAIGLYKKYGFEELSRRKNYYSAPVEDALIMEWKSI